MHAEAATPGLDPSEILASYVAKQSISRIVDRSEVACVIAFLASASAAVVSGQVFAVDGNAEIFHLE